jgi:hypothetical protein
MKKVVSQAQTFDGFKHFTCNRLLTDRMSTKSEQAFTMLHTTGDLHEKSMGCFYMTVCLLTQP